MSYSISSVPRKGTHVAQERGFKQTNLAKIKEALSVPHNIATIHPVVVLDPELSALMTPLLGSLAGTVTPADKCEMHAATDHARQHLCHALGIRDSALTYFLRVQLHKREVREKASHASAATGDAKQG